MHIKDFQKLNLERSQVWHKGGIEEWSISDWACAMAGEAGEACNAVKKLRRIECGTGSANNPEDTQKAIDAIAAELADTFCYLTLVASRLGIDFEEALKKKFNYISEREGLTQFQIKEEEPTGLSKYQLHAEIFEGQRY